MPTMPCMQPMFYFMSAPSPYQYFGSPQMMGIPMFPHHSFNQLPNASGNGTTLPKDAAMENIESTSPEGF